MANTSPKEAAEIPNIDHSNVVNSPEDGDMVGIRDMSDIDLENQSQSEGELENIPTFNQYFRVREIIFIMAIFITFPVFYSSFVYVAPLVSILTLVGSCVLISFCGETNSNDKAIYSLGVLIGLWELSGLLQWGTQPFLNGIVGVLIDLIQVGISIVYHKIESRHLCWVQMILCAFLPVNQIQHMTSVDAFCHAFFFVLVWCVDVFTRIRVNKNEKINIESLSVKYIVILRMNMVFAVLYSGVALGLRIMYIWNPPPVKVGEEIVVSSPPPVLILSTPSIPSLSSPPLPLPLSLSLSLPSSSVKFKHPEKEKGLNPYALNQRRPKVPYTSSFRRPSLEFGVSPIVKHLKKEQVQLQGSGSGMDMGSGFYLSGQIPNVLEGASQIMSYFGKNPNVT